MKSWGGEAREDQKVRMWGIWGSMVGVVKGLRCCGWGKRVGEICEGLCGRGLDCLDWCEWWVGSCERRDVHLLTCTRWTGIWRGRVLSFENSWIVPLGCLNGLINILSKTRRPSLIFGIDYCFTTHFVFVYVIARGRGFSGARHERQRSLAKL